MGLKHSRGMVVDGRGDVGVGSTVVPMMMIRVVVVVAVGSEEGRVKLYDRPVCAREVMKEFPTHLICHSDSFFIGHKLPPLSHDEQLRLGNTYFLLPNHFFHSVLSFLAVANSLCMIIVNKHNNKKKKNSMLFDIHKTEEGMLQIRISEDVLTDMITINSNKTTSSSDDVNVMSRVLCSTTELEEYNRIVNRSRELWKPTLDTIHELYHSSSNSSYSKRTSCWFPMQLLFRRNSN